MAYHMNSWQELRNHYARHHDEIMSAPAWGYGIDPYAWDDGKGWVWMTPIETAIWHDIRCVDIVMYPQYPACGFFLDFANPVAKVAIECDGRAFHDSAIDRERDRILGLDGWKVYRMTGRECLLDGEDDERGKYQLSPGEILCRKLGEECKIGSRWAKT